MADKRRTLGLIGPSASGKTQLKAFMLNQHINPPQILREIYRIPVTKDVADARHADARSVFGFRNATYQLAREKTKEVDVGAVDDEAGAATGTMQRRVREIAVQYGGGAVPVMVKDFPGEFMDPRAKASDVEWEEERRRRIREFEALTDLILVVPFWHLLPNELFAALADRLPVLMSDRTAADLTAVNGDMHANMKGWFDAMDVLAQNPDRHRLVIAVSQFGGETLRCARALWRHQEGPVIDEFHDLDVATATAHGLSRWNSDPGWRRPIRLATGVAAIKALDLATRRFLVACDQAKNETANALGRYGMLSPEHLTFNVVSGMPVRLHLENGNTVEAFEREPVNFHLLLASIWQRSARDEIW